MLQDDYILRQIREMVRAVMKMLFQVDAQELTPAVDVYKRQAWKLSSYTEKRLREDIKDIIRLAGSAGKA